MFTPKFSYFYFLFASFLYFSFFVAYFPAISPNNFFSEKNLFFIILFSIPNLLVSLYGISIFFLPTAILFLYRNTKFWIQWIFYFSVPLGVSILAGILWKTEISLIYMYFGSFALVSRELFSTSFWKIFIVILNSFALFLILLRYRISPFFLVFISNISYFCIGLLSFKEKNTSQKKYFYQKAIDNFKKTCYKLKTLLNFLTNPKYYSNLPFKNKSAKPKLGLQNRSGLPGSASQGTKSIKKISSENDFGEYDKSFHSDSLQELFNVFHSISKIKKKK